MAPHREPVEHALTEAVFRKAICVFAYPEEGFALRADHEPPIAVRGTPEWWLWCRVARALGQLLACLAHRHTGPVRGGTDVGDRCEQGVLPEVVGLPPGDLIKQVRFGPAMEGCCGQHRVLELRVFPAAEGALGQEPLA